MKRPFKFMTCPYRKWIWVWWKYWLSPFSYVNAVKSYWHRARYGYDVEDLFSLDCYLAHWMPSALEDLFFAMKKYLLLTEKDLHDMITIHEAWEGLRHLSWDCECWDNEENWKPKDKDFWDKHDAYWKKRWEYGSKVFVERIQWLWY